MIKYFGIEELVPKHVFDDRGEKAWQLLNYRALKTLEWLRLHLGYATVNDWLWDGVYSQSGLRTHEIYMQSGISLEESLKKIAASYSQHKYGNAFDVKFQYHTAQEARQFIRDNCTYQALIGQLP